jgi:ADP-ribose pyrophosphatase YjhB (NUDIX family)
MEKKSRTKTVLEIGREIQAISQSGLSFSKDPYDKERYESLKRLSNELITGSSSHEEEYIEKVFSAEKGYVTPKLDVRAAVFREEKILLIKEKVTGHWTLPGGYIDVNETLKESAEREVLEETGFTVSARKIAAIYDHRLHGYKPHLYHFYKIYMICDFVSGEPTSNIESEELGYFSVSEIMNLTIDPGRAFLPHIIRMFDHYHNPSLQADFD